MSIDDLADRTEPPSNATSLKALIRNVARADGRDPRLMEIAYAGVIVSQMLPGVMRGGQALKVRIGPIGTRFSEDVDVVVPHDVLPEQFDGWLEQGSRTWGGFMITLTFRKKAASPPGVPPDHVIRTYTAHILYQGRAFTTVTLEVGRDEIGGIDDPVRRVPSEWRPYFAKIGLPDPGEATTFPPDHQIAQKLHGCTTPDRHGHNDRAHDVVDIQIILDDEPTITPRMLKDVARRTFAYRNTTWPPVARKFPAWDELYPNEARPYPFVEQDVDRAVAWLQRFIDEIDR